MSSFEVSLPTLRHPRRWWLLGWAIIAVILYLSLMPSPPKVAHLSDKVEHAFAYTLLMSWFAQLSRRHLLLLVLLIAMGVAVEFVQGLGPWRHFDVRDMVANSVGVVLGWAMAYLGVHYLRWLEWPVKA